MVKFEYYFARQSEPNMSKRTPAVLPDEIDPSRLPRHIAIICDGNGRWARERGMPRLLGHHQGYQSVREIVRSASDFGIGALTLYAFSTENWSRPKDETDGLMSLFIEGAKRELMESLSCLLFPLQTQARSRHRVGELSHQSSRGRQLSL